MAQFPVAIPPRQWLNGGVHTARNFALLTAVEKIILFTAMVLSVMACQQSPDPATLRGAHYDPAQYFDNDRLRANTLIACRAGSSHDQMQWSALYACRTSASTDLAKHRGWKPGTGSPR
jgi:hypothetical protein